MEMPLSCETSLEVLEANLPDGVRGPLTPFGEGDFCAAFRAGDHVVRVARHAEAAAALRVETCVLGRISDDLPVRVPGLTLHSPVEGVTFTVHEMVRGAVLTREVWKAMPAGQRDSAAEGLAGFLRALHGIPVTAAERCGLKVHSSSETAGHLLRIAAALLHPHLKDADRARLDRFLRRCRDGELPGRFEQALIHCDIAPDHVLFDPASGRVTGVIDFGDIAIGDPARDFIYIYDDFGPDRMESVLGFYQRHDHDAFRLRIRCWYLLELISWAAGLAEDGDFEAAREGFEEIESELKLI